MSRLLLLCVLIVSCFSSALYASEVDPFLEAYALGDREAALKQLIPGTENFYFYHCLYAQQTDNQQLYQQTLDDWKKKLRYSSAQRKAIELRQSLLNFSKNPQQTVDYLKRLLGIRLNHQRSGASNDRNLPTALDQNRITWKAFANYVTRQYPDSLLGYEQHTFEQLPSRGLSLTQLRQYLRQLQQPEVPDLVAAIVRELADRRSGGFGSLPIHQNLLLSQLQKLAKAAPKVLNNEKYIRAYLQRLQPRNGSGWRDDVQQREQYLESLWAFVSTLSAGHNSLKAHILYHRLVHDRQQGVFNRQRFMIYMSLPRQAVYMNPVYLKRNNRNFVNLSADFHRQTSFPRIGNDQELIRSYLENFFIHANNYASFPKYFEENYLKKIFAEQKVLLGKGDMEQWASWLGTSQFRAIQERIELGFSAQNATDFPVGKMVSVQLRIKNIKKMLIRVYPINTVAWYADNKRQLKTDFDVDGLVTELESQKEYTQLPAIRHTENIELPELNKRGVYIVEFLGNGYRCRSMITIGNLNVRERVGTAGHVLTVFDGQHKKVKNAVVQLGNQRFVADAGGSILIPFASRAGRKQVVIEHEGFAVLYDLQHQQEQYKLQIDSHVEQQEALAGSSARVMLRPQLFAHGQAMSLRDLKNISVTIDAVTLDNVHSTSVLDNVKLNELDAWTHDIRMPERVQRIDIRIQAEIEHISTGEKQQLTASSSVVFNGLMKSQNFKDVYLRPTQSGYFLDVLGRNGEAYANEAMKRVEIKHRDFKTWQSFYFRTNAQGSISLGALKEISNVRVSWSGQTRHWTLLHDRQLQSDDIHIRDNQDLTLAWAYDVTDLKLARLLSQRGAVWHSAYSQYMSINADGRLHIRALPAGDYRLLLPRNSSQIRIIVEAGQRHDGGIFGTHRILSDTVPHGLSVSGLEIQKDAYRVKVYGSTAATRVHIVAPRFISDLPLIETLGSIAQRQQSELYPFRSPSWFLEMQRLSDEHRYILDRTQERVYPTLMLKRPALLLHPWKREATEGFAAVGAGGGASGSYGSRTGGGKKRESGRYGGSRSSGNVIPVYDFLQYGAVVLSNLAIDKDGYVTIPKELFADQQYMQILAVEPEQSFQCNVLLPAITLQRREQRLMQSLGTTVATQRQSRSVAQLKKGQQQNVAADPSSWRVLSTLAEAFELLDTLCDDTRLKDFTFIKYWPTLSAGEKVEKYSEYASHELHLFLYLKDRVFFDTHVANTLSNKHDKTFIDHYLLENDLTAYLRPWAFARLNAFERAVLARRLGVKSPEGAGILRSLTETVDMQVRDSKRDEFLFYTVLRGKDLHGKSLPEGESLGATMFGNEKQKSKKDKLRKFNKSAMREEEKEERTLEEFDVSVASKVIMDSIIVTDLELPSVGAGYFADDRKAAAKKAQRLYRPLESTKEWAENNYYQRRPLSENNSQLAALIEANEFWLAYATHTDGAFIHKRFTDCAANASEVLLALAVSDLPFTAEQHTYAKTPEGRSISAGSDALLYYMTFADMQAADDMPLVAIQNLYRVNDRYRHEKGQRIEKFVSGPCLYRDVYGAQLVLTNPTARPFQVDVLAQIPQGAIPLSVYKATLGKTMTLNAYSIQRIDVRFYFPEIGDFSWYAASLNNERGILAQAGARKLQVLAQLPDTDRSSWQYIADFASDAEVLNYLQTHNIQRLDLSRIAFRMHKRTMFRSVIDVLSAAKIYKPVLWSYGFKHLSVPEMKEWLRHNQRVAQQCGLYFESPLLSLDAVERLRYEHLEYYPLVNGRTHAFAGKRQISNDALAGNYKKFLETLTYVSQLRNHDKLAAVVYYIAQERIEEAIELFAGIQRDDIHQRMQYDYCKAYLALCQEDIASAEKICAEYTDFPIQRWQEAFAVMSAQIEEIRDDTARVINGEDRNQDMAQRALSTAMLDIESQGNSVRLSYRNLESCTMNFYRMDLELLFSRNAFMRGEGGQFAYVAPNVTQQIILPEGQNQLNVTLPAALKQGNVLVEVVAAGLRRRVVLFVHQLQVLTQDNFGQLQVRHKVTGKVKSKVYIKVYARMQNGQVKFYKDGYTDLRGRFDYASISSSGMENAQRFSILIVDKKDGALVREVAAPAQ